MNPKEPHWYVLYTKARAEKKVEIELRKKGFETFLPIHKTLKQWSDRKKWVEEPLFRSYLFIKIELEKVYYDVLNTYGVVRFISFEKKPVIISDSEIRTIHLILGHFEHIEVTEENLEPGQTVEIIGGPLIGRRGVLIEKRGNQQFALELEGINQKLLLKVPLEYLRLSNQEAKA
ncbi:MAG: UpxY family transcription antiterminator [Bacteroidetes bacterium]|nr:UpxY family transcription antiterminator [Bacteroidota bacterium]